MTFSCMVLLSFLLSYAIIMIGSAHCLHPLDLACDVIDNRVERKRPQYVQLISKQMVRVFFWVCVRRSLQKHTQNRFCWCNKASDKFGVFSLLFMQLNTLIITVSHLET